MQINSAQQNNQLNVISNSVDQTLVINQSVSEHVVKGIIEARVQAALLDAARENAELRTAAQAALHRMQAMGTDEVQKLNLEIQQQAAQADLTIKREALANEQRIKETQLQAAEHQQSLRMQAEAAVQSETIKRSAIVAENLRLRKELDALKSQKIASRNLESFRTPPVRRRSPSPAMSLRPAEKHTPEPFGEELPPPPPPPEDSLETATVLESSIQNGTDNNMSELL